MKIWENFKNKIDKYKFKNLFLSMFVFCILVLTIFPTIAYAQILSVDGVVSSVSKFIAEILLKISSAFLGLAGSIFDYIVRTTILEMGDKMSNQEGLGGSISSAWLTLRDIANMCFIFVLLFTAFKAMFSLNFGNTGRTILNIVLVALLINFSLFFTKVVIDASNIVSEGFYNSIVSYGANPPQNEGQTNTGTQKSITGGYMRMVNINSWYDVNGNLEAVSDAGKVLVTGFMGSIFFLITAVVFMISAFMFLARFLILIFLMILSPVAFIAIIVPGMSSHFEKWKSAVIDQSIFAPVFFALTWIVFKLGTTEGFLTRGSVFTDLTTGPPTKDSMALVFNFLIIIGMAIMALIVSKQIATRTAGFTAITGGIAAGAIGGGAMIGRQTIGRGASRLEKSQRFQRLAARHQKTFGNLYSGTQKMARGSFDARSIDTIKKVPGLGKELDILGAPSEKGKGGFEKYREEKTKKMVEKGKQFTDRQARVTYARNVASKIHAHRGSIPNNVNSLFGMMGRSNRIAAATLLDERIRELRTDMNSARGELNTLNNQMGFTPNTGIYAGVFVAPAAMVATLTPAEQARYNILNGPVTTNGSIASMSAEMQNLNDPTTGLRTTLGLNDTLRQQF